MSFKAVITTTLQQSIWSKAIHTLSTINQTINFTITSNELLIWTMNSTDTTMCQISLYAEFFDEYCFEPGMIVFGEEGVQLIEDVKGWQHKLYSFQINGRHLSLLARKPDSDPIKKYTILINNTSTCPESMVNKLQIGIYTESLITKEFSPGFNPIKYDPIVIDLKYKKRFLDIYATSAESQESEMLDPRLVGVFEVVRRQLDNAKFNQSIAAIQRPKVLQPENEINFISMDSTIWKNFIATCTASTEEIKLDLNINKMVITAFSKGIYNLRKQDVLKQAISMSNSIDTQDLEHYCLFNTTEGHERDPKNLPTKQISFKLKDFKNFFTVNQAWKGSCIVNCWFCMPGDPVFFEIDRDEVKLTLVQITDDVSINGLAQQKKTIQPVARSPKKTANLLDKATSEAHKMRAGSTPPADSASSLPVRRNWHRNPVQSKLFLEDEEDYEGGVNITQDQLEQRMSSLPGSRALKRAATTVAWGATESRDDSPHEDQITILKKEKQKFLEHLKVRKLENKNHKNVAADNEDTRDTQGTDLGPTQQSLPKGLFDKLDMM
ncbi:HER071Cp [Eremothecium sinecaudum]|uniref:HER071Cp n=1 Tax=Eremothecium sinecaudum TaxID=45286 RepID=A0A0X8HTX0_9SACH|nr:HER071Cp [Eremothecium sinecaudum]AMD21350.1 HER071Cp [Eremothecium sinecaudum]